MADIKSLYSLVNIRKQNPFLRKYDEVHKQWRKVLIARKVVTKSRTLAYSKRAEPSYESLCAQRYRNARKKYNVRFRDEIISLEAMQPNASDAMRFHRHFTITTLWPPIYSEREIRWTLKQLRSILSTRERRRLEHILA